MGKKLSAGLAFIAGVGALILASTASDPAGSIRLVDENGVEHILIPRLYRSATIGDGRTPETAWRPAIADDLDVLDAQEGKVQKHKWDPETEQVIVWVEESDHGPLAVSHEFLGAPEAGP